MIFSFILFLIINIFFSWRLLFQLSELKTNQVLVIAHCALVWFLGATQVLFYTDKISYAQHELALKTSLVGIFSIFMTLICILAIKNLSARKIKTLWRVPILGILVGMYFEWKYIPLICTGYCVVAAIILLKDKIRLRFLLKKAILMILAGFLVFIVTPGQLLFINLFLILVLMASFPILNMANITSLFNLEENT